MKESISVTTIFQIVILFILLFTAIMCLTINNSNAFGVKDRILNIIEMNNGNYLDGDNLNEDIVEAISQESYRTTGICEDDYTGYERNGERVNPGDRASICIKEVNVTEGIDEYLYGILQDSVSSAFVEGKYYQIILFYQLDLPVFRQAYNFRTKGETRIIYQENRDASTSFGNSSSSGDDDYNPNITDEEIYDNLFNGGNSGNNSNTGDGNTTGSEGTENNGSNTGTGSGDTTTGENGNLSAEELACRDGLVENSRITGIQAVAMARVAFYPTVQDAASGNTNGKTMDLNGTKVTILGNNGAADGSGWWAIMYNGECGWVDSDYMAINAASYLPSNFRFNITNASSSRYVGINGTNIPNLTGVRLYDSSQYNNSFVPITFPFARKLYNIGVNNSSRTFLINDAYRPYKVTKYAYTTANKVPAVTSGFGNWHPTWFLAQNVSKHNTACAVDITFGDLTQEQLNNMPSPMHELSVNAAPYTSSAKTTYTQSFINTQAHVLHDIMMAGGLTDLASEWWHYQDNDCHSRITGHASTGGGKNIYFYRNQSVTG